MQIRYVSPLLNHSEGLQNKAYRFACSLAKALTLWVGLYFALPYTQVATPQDPIKKMPTLCFYGHFSREHVLSFHQIVVGSKSLGILTQQTEEKSNLHCQVHVND